MHLAGDAGALGVAGLRGAGLLGALGVLGPLAQGGEQVAAGADVEPGGDDGAAHDDPERNDDGEVERPLDGTDERGLAVDVLVDEGRRRPDARDRQHLAPAAPGAQRDQGEGGRADHGRRGHHHRAEEPGDGDRVAAAQRQQRGPGGTEHEVEHQHRADGPLVAGPDVGHGVVRDEHPQHHRHADDDEVAPGPRPGAEARGRDGGRLGGHGVERRWPAHPSASPPRRGPPPPEGGGTPPPAPRPLRPPARDASPAADAPGDRPRRGWGP